MKTLEDVKRVREIASELEELGVSRKTAVGFSCLYRIRRWANKEEKRIRDEARENSPRTK